MTIKSAAKAKSMTEEAILGQLIRETANDCREHLAKYCRFMQPGGYVVKPMHRKAIDALEALERGDIQNLMLFMPFQTGKSILACHLFPTWYLGRRPTDNVMITAYNQTLANSHGGRARNLADSAKYQVIFPDIKMSHDTKSKGRWDINKGGSISAAGKGGTITGRPVSLFILDDWIKEPDEAMSRTMRDGDWDFYKTIVQSRVGEHGKQIFCVTRWHDDDVPGRCLNEDAGKWTVVSIPALNDEGVSCWPEKYSAEYYATIRETVGPYRWNALYQQNPIPEEGCMIKAEWFAKREPPEQIMRKIHSWDTAFKTGQENDYSVCLLGLQHQTGLHLGSMLRERMEYPVLRERMLALAGRDNPSVILIEDKASGQSIIQDLRGSTSLPIIAVEVDKDKQRRATLATGYLEAGRVSVPESAPWLSNFWGDVLRFPNAAHDDVTDALTQLINWISIRRIGSVFA